MYIILNILKTLSKIVQYLIIGVSVILLPGVLIKEGAYNVAKHGAMEVIGGIMLMHVIPLIIFAILYVWIEPKLKARIAAMEEFEEEEEIEALYNRGNSKYDSEDYKGAIADYWTCNKKVDSRLS
jgi:hypothetical protein